MFGSGDPAAMLDDSRNWRTKWCSDKKKASSRRSSAIDTRGMLKVVEYVGGCGGGSGGGSGGGRVVEVVVVEMVAMVMVVCVGSGAADGNADCGCCAVAVCGV